MSAAIAKAAGGNAHFPPTSVLSFRIRPEPIVRLAAMKIDALGVTGEIINGLTSRCGNVSSCSIPFALKQQWNRLGVSLPAPLPRLVAPIPEMSQGCLLQTTLLHSKLASAA
jgi:hypothetical protein